jgi:hypothetical protein
MNNIISLDEYREKKQQLTKPKPKHEMTLEERKERIKESIKRINSLMEEIRKNQQ